MAWADLDWTSGDRLRKAYEAAGYKGATERLAAEAATTRQTIARWQNGIHAPQDAKFTAVAEILAARLSVKTDELVKWIATGELPAYSFRFGG